MTSGVQNCIVPLCTSTTNGIPKKCFFAFPKEEKQRNIWLKLSKCTDKLSKGTTALMCEDHFNLKKDLENYVQYSVLNMIPRYKANAVPRYFECQGRNATRPQTKLATIRASKQDNPELLNETDPLQIFGVDTQENLQAYTSEASTWPSSINLDDFTIVPTNSLECKIKNEVQEDSIIQPQTPSPESTPEACSSNNIEICEDYFKAEPEQLQEVEVPDGNYKSEPSLEKTHLQDNIEVPNQSCCNLEISQIGTLSQNLPEVVNKPKCSSQPKTSEILKSIFSLDLPKVIIKPNYSSQPSTSKILSQSPDNPKVAIQAYQGISKSNFPKELGRRLININPVKTSVSEDKLKSLGYILPSSPIYYILNNGPGLSVGPNCSVEELNRTSINQILCYGVNNNNNNNKDLGGLMGNTVTDVETRLKDSVIQNETQLKGTKDGETRCSSGNLLSVDKTQEVDCTSFSKEVLVSTHSKEKDADHPKDDKKNCDSVPSNDTIDENDIGGDWVKKCFKCDRVFYSVQCLRNHFEQHEPFFCYQCSIYCKDYDDFIQHKRKKKLHKKEEYTCNRCCKKYKRRWCDLYKHLESNCMLGRIIFSRDPICEACSKNSEIDPNVHRCTHQPKRRKIKCPLCSKELSHPKSLRAHMLRHNALLKGEYPFNCAECPKKFLRRFDIRMHMTLHTRDFKYVCKICRGKYTRSANLRTHMKNNHRKMCLICRGIFSTNDIMEHLKSHSSEEITAMTDNRHKILYVKYTDFQCQLCNKYFASNNSLLVHKKKHKTTKSMSMKIKNMSKQTVKDKNCLPIENKTFIILCANADKLTLLTQPSNFFPRQDESIPKL